MLASVGINAFCASVSGNFLSAAPSDSVRRAAAFPVGAAANTTARAVFDLDQRRQKLRHGGGLPGPGTAGDH
ncbi:hypothetical protein KPZU09_66060 [Klebsiella pneumoniae]|uniref:Uncharacterized protein n=1 Tax=Klebsiella pneumoniae TaxID=573 RepID=A0A919HZ74_KLEPN|nr:hypothetical protein KPZU09_66060 [Klebsiella pneumoniae]